MWALSPEKRDTDSIRKFQEDKERHKDVVHRLVINSNLSMSLYIPDWERIGTRTPGMPYSLHHGGVSIECDETSQNLQEVVIKQCM